MKPDRLAGRWRRVYDNAHGGRRPVPRGRGAPPRARAAGQARARQPHTPAALQRRTTGRYSQP